jgi:outer membrane usher protein
MNTVDIDPKDSSTDVEFASTSEHAVPRLGSVVMLKYKTVTGRAALIRAPRLGGEGLPFGADVLDARGNNVGVVAQDSRIFARGIEDKGTLVVRFGKNDGDVCRIQYELPVRSEKPDAGYTSIEAHCVGGAMLSVDENAAQVHLR